MVASLEAVSLRIARDPAAATALSTARRRRAYPLRSHHGGACARCESRRNRRHGVRPEARRAGPGPDVLRRFRAIELAVRGRCSSRGRRWGFGSSTFDRYRRQTADASARSPPSTSSRRRPRPRLLRPVISRCPRRWLPPFSGCGTKCPDDTARAGALAPPRADR